MKKPAKNLLLLLAFMTLSMWIYPLVQGHLAALYIPFISSLPRTKIAGAACLAAGAATASLICAFVLAWPLGYLTREKPIIFGGALGVVGIGIHLYYFPNVIVQFNWFVGAISITEHLAFLFGCMAFAFWGSNIANRKNGQHTLRA